MINQSEIDDLRNKYPFLSVVVFNNETAKLGLIQKQTESSLWMWDYEKITKERLKVNFLEAAKRWFHETDQTLPPDMFIGPSFSVFSAALNGYARRDVKEIHGPCVNLDELSKRRIKRKSVSI